MQALVENSEAVVELVLLGIREDDWWVGIGIGAVEVPLGHTSADSRGSAFYNARDAMTEAKDSTYGFAVSGDDSPRARAVAANLTLLALLASRRGGRQWEAVDLVRHGLSQKEVGQKLGITPQAVSQRLQSAAWQEECEGRWLANWLLASVVAIDA
jgi:hypothetical protein